MVGIVIVSHSSILAQGVEQLARGVGGPDIPIWAVGGLDLPDSPLGTDANQILQAIQAVYSTDGVVVLMDLGSAILSAEMALEMLPPEQRGNIWLCEAPLVEGAVAAAVQARLGSPVEQVLAEARGSLRAKSAQLGVAAPSGADLAPQPPVDRSGSQAELILAVPNRLGLHARPAARFVQTAASFPRTQITVQNLSTGSPMVNAKSINSLATLGLRQGHTLRLAASGGDVQAALAALRRLAEQNFGDEEPSPTPLMPAVAAPGQPSTSASPAAWASTVSGTGASGDLLQGLAISPGLAHAPARRVGLELASPPASLSAAQTAYLAAHPVTDPATEWDALQIAIEQTKTQVQVIRQGVLQRLGAYDAAIFDAHLLFLDDPALLEPARSAIMDSGLDAASAWMAAVEHVAAGYRQLEDEYQRLRLSDLENVGYQVLQQLLKDLPGYLPAAPLFSQPNILLAVDLSPADIAQLDPEQVRGICTVLGGPTSHSAILARSLGIPAVAGLGEALLQVADDTSLLVDGGSGQVWLDPGPDILTEFEGRITAARQSAATARELSTAPAVTRDGRHIEAFANIGSLADARLAVACGAEGIGLFRTEFLFLNRTRPPDEDEQYAAYRQVAEALSGCTLTIRTLDAGGDKPLPYLDLGVESNPYLGWRAIRLCLARPDFFKQQLRAIQRLAADFPVRVMFPLIATLDEWLQARSLLAEARLELVQGGLPAPERIQTGMMVETPAAALRLADFAAEADFFSIGSNDLIQYTLAAERGNPRLAELSDPLQPAVLQLIKGVIDVAHSYDKPVAVCGEMAADLPSVVLLVSLGIDGLSMNPASLPQVKQLVRKLEFKPLRLLAQAALRLESASAVRGALQEYQAN